MRKHARVAPWRVRSVAAFVAAVAVTALLQLATASPAASPAAAAQCLCQIVFTGYDARGAIPGLPRVAAPHALVAPCTCSGSRGDDSTACGTRLTMTDPRLEAYGYYSVPGVDGSATGARNASAWAAALGAARVVGPVCVKRDAMRGLYLGPWVRAASPSPGDPEPSFTVVLFNQLAHHSYALMLAERMTAVGVEAVVRWQPELPGETPPQAVPEATHPASEAACSEWAVEQAHSPCYRHRRRLHVMLLSPPVVGDVMAHLAAGCPHWLALRPRGQEVAADGAAGGEGEVLVPPFGVGQWWCPPVGVTDPAPSTRVGGSGFHLAVDGARPPGAAPLLFVQVVLPPAAVPLAAMEVTSRDTATRRRTALAFSFAADTWVSNDMVLRGTTAGAPPVGLRRSSLPPFLVHGPAPCAWLHMDSVGDVEAAGARSGNPLRVAYLGTARHPTAAVASAQRRGGSVTVVEVDVDQVPSSEVIRRLRAADVVITAEDPSSHATLLGTLPLLLANGIVPLVTGGLLVPRDMPQSLVPSLSQTRLNELVTMGVESRARWSAAALDALRERWGSDRILVPRYRLARLARRDFATYDFVQYPTRQVLIQAIIDTVGATSYLEVGCYEDDTFSTVKVQHAVCVDPNSGGSHRMTSDEYFARHPGDTYDVVFIDGLHTAQQAARDVDNALRALRPGGFIVMHDSNPRDEYEGAKTWTRGTWNGDVYRVVVALRQRRDLDVVTVNVDSGCAVVHVAQNTSPLTLPTEVQVREVSYAELDAHRHQWLRLVGYADALAWVRGYAVASARQ